MGDHSPFNYYPRRRVRVVRILGFQKLTLLDYPGKVACTIFIGGCNFKCPFCHNADLVINPSQQEKISPQTVLATLKKRQGILEGVCITGGEPTLATDLKDFLAQVKGLGYQVKLDTNGYHPEVLIELVGDGLVDYVAVDIKNSPLKYPETVGLEELNITKIQETIDYLRNASVDYEFRTTVVRELHTACDMQKIGQWISGCKRYFLQGYQESEQVIKPIFTSYTKEEMLKMRDDLKSYIETVEIRGL